MEIFAKRKIYDFMGKSKAFALVSIVMVVLSIFSLMTKGLNYGVDFAGGTLVQIKYDKDAPIAQMREILNNSKKFEGVSITKFGSNEEVIVKFSGSSEDVVEDIGAKLANILKDTGKLEIRRVDMVGAKVGNELRENGAMAFSLSILAILAYLAFRFEYRFAFASIMALVHDVVIVMGAISFFEIDVNLEILAAILTLIGYSLNDTIVIFDRIREQIKESKENFLSAIINESVSLTLPRTLLTSLSTFFVIFTLFTFGGEIIHGFSFSLLIGILIGSYSSVFIAAPTLSFLKFNVQSFRAKEAEKEKRRIEKEKQRAMYERGIV